MYLVVEILQLVYEISSFLEELYKRGDLKTSQNSQSKDVLKNFAKFIEKHL